MFLKYFSNVCMFYKQNNISTTYKLCVLNSRQQQPKTDSPN